MNPDRARAINRKYAYHRLRLPSGEVITGPVVVTVDSHNRVEEWHLLHGEEPMVEWIGGEFSAP